MQSKHDHLKVLISQGGPLKLEYALALAEEPLLLTKNEYMYP
jgi:hypothetical protein